MSHASARALCRRAVVALAALLLTAGVAGGLSGAAGGSSSPASSGARIARFGTTVDADDLNPFLGRSGTSHEILHLNYDFLVGYDTDLSPRPELAESWETSPDGRVWTFHLREGVTWQDGEPFTAADVVFTYRYIIDNDLGAFTSYTDGIEEIVAVDDLTVTMTCGKPKANMLRLSVPILPEHIWTRVPGGRAGVDWAVEPPIVGTGPFQTVEVEKGASIRLVKNPDYWLKGRPTIDELVVRVYRDADTMTQDLKTGVLDYAQGIPAAQYAALGSERALMANAADIRGFDGLCMNCYDDPHSLGDPVLRDERFRRAISWAVDRRKIVESAFGGYARVGQGIISPGVPDYVWEPVSGQLLGFRPERAMELLDEAGYEDSDGDGVREGKDGEPIELRLWARTDDVAGQNTGRLVAGWFEDIGLKIVYQTLDVNAIGDALFSYDEAGDYAPDYDICVLSWGEHVDPDSILNAFTTGQIEGRNGPAWSNADYDRLYERQAQTVDQALRKPLVDEMASILYDSAPYIVTNYEQQLEGYNAQKWEGWTPVPAGGPVAFVNDNIDTYLNLKPAPAAQEGAGSSTWAYATVALAVLGIAVAVVLLLRRGRGQPAGR